MQKLLDRIVGTSIAGVVAEIEYMEKIHKQNKAKAEALNKEEAHKLSLSK